MAIKNWMELEEDLSPAAMTVRAQTISPNDDGKLIWDMFFPRMNTPSVDLKDISVIDWRPASDRREWNARGRRIPLLTPATREVSIIPVEANHAIDEKEMQKLMEQTGGNSNQLREIIGASIPARVDMLTLANYRRMELDAMEAWSLGTITQRNPEDASKTVTASFGFSNTRYTTTMTDWDDAGTNAYEELLDWIAAAEELVGEVEGIMLRKTTFDAILADAPDLPNSVNMTRSQLGDRVSQDTGKPFYFYINEKTVDVFTDGGIVTTATKIWPAEIVAAIPSGMRIGSMYFAPVVRAMELAREAGDAGIDVNGMTAYHEASNGGRRLDIEVQVNSIPVPDESKLYVTDVNV